MKWRPCVAVVTAITAVGMVTSGAGAKTHAPAAQVVVKFAAWSVDNSKENTALNADIKRFEKAYNYIKVEFQQLSSDNPEADLEAQFNEDEAPDVFEVDAGWIRDFATTNHVQRENWFARHDKSFNTKDFPKSIVSAFTSGSSTYAYPTGYTTLGLWYNKDLLTAAGYKAMPSNWQAYSQLACKLTNDTTHVYGASLSADAYHWFAFLGGFGGRVLNSTETASAINSKSNVNALTWYDGMIKSGCAETPQSDSNIQEFAAGNAATIIEPSTSVEYLKSLAPKFHWGITPLPKGPKGTSDISDAVGFAINASSPVKKAAWKLIHFLNEPKSMSAMDTSAGYLPGRYSVSPSKPTAAFVRGANHSRMWAWPAGLEVNAFPHIDTDIQAASTGNISYDDAVSDMSDWIKQYLPESTSGDKPKS